MPRVTIRDIPSPMLRAIREAALPQEPVTTEVSIDADPDNSYSTSVDVEGVVTLPEAPAEGATLTVTSALPVPEHVNCRCGVCEIERGNADETFEGTTLEVNVDDVEVNEDIVTTTTYPDPRVMSIYASCITANRATEVTERASWSATINGLYIEIEGYRELSPNEVPFHRAATEESRNEVYVTHIPAGLHRLIIDLRQARITSTHSACDPQTGRQRGHDFTYRWKLTNFSCENRSFMREQSIAAMYHGGPPSANVQFPPRREDRTLRSGMRDERSVESVEVPGRVAEISDLEIRLDLMERGVSRSPYEIPQLDTESEAMGHRGLSPSPDEPISASSVDISVGRMPELIRQLQRLTGGESYESVMSDDGVPECGDRPVTMADYAEQQIWPGFRATPGSLERHRMDMVRRHAEENVRAREGMYSSTSMGESMARSMGDAMRAASQSIRNFGEVFPHTIIDDIDERDDVPPSPEALRNARESWDRAVTRREETTGVTPTHADIDDAVQDEIDDDMRQRAVERNNAALAVQRETELTGTDITLDTNDNETLTAAQIRMQVVEIMNRVYIPDGYRTATGLIGTQENPASPETLANTLDVFTGYKRLICRIFNNSEAFAWGVEMSAEDMTINCQIDWDSTGSNSDEYNHTFPFSSIREGTITGDSVVELFRGYIEEDEDA